MLFSVAFGQQRKNTGTIRGVVREATTRQAVIGAVVYLEGTQPPLSASTYSTGEFVIDNVPEGKYNLIVSLVGYKTTRWEGVSVFSGQISQMMMLLEEETDTELGPVQITIQKATDTEISLYSQLKGFIFRDMKIRRNQLI